MLKGETAQKFDTGTDQVEFVTVCLVCELKVCVGGSDCKEAKSWLNIMSEFQRPVDLAFLIDGSNSISENNFYILRKFVIELIGNGYKRYR